MIRGLENQNESNRNKSNNIQLRSEEQHNFRRIFYFYEVYASQVMAQASVELVAQVHEAGLLNENCSFQKSVYLKFHYFQKLLKNQ